MTFPRIRVKDFEAGFYPFIREKYPTIPQGIREKKELTEELSKLLHQAVQEYKKNFIGLGLTGKDAKRLAFCA